MITDAIYSCAVIAGAAILWRNFRYDKENPANKYLDRLPYWLRKPVTCGVCFTYWAAGAYAIVVDPLTDWIPPFRFPFGAAEALMTFFFCWMILGTGAAFIVYVLDTFFEISHYYKHKAAHEHKETKHQ